MTAKGGPSNLIQAREFYFPLDEQGYVVNPCSWDHLKSPWREAVVATAVAVADLCPRQHALYLRGSVPLGRGLAGVSDLDFFLIAEQPPDEDTLCRLDDQLKADFPILTHVDVQCCRPKELVQFPTWEMGIATQSLLVGGTPIDTRLPRYQPGPEMVVHLFSLRDSLAQYLAAKRDTPAADHPQWMQWLCRVVLRSGFELVMARVPCYTRELYSCYRQFATFYPDHDEAMFRVLELAIAPEAALDGDFHAIQNLAAFLHAAMLSHMGHVYLA